MRKIQTQDLVAAARVITEIGIKEELKAMCKKADTMADVWDNGFDLVYTIFEKAVAKNSEQKIYEFIAGLLEQTPEEVRTSDLMDMMDALTQVADVEQWKAFFTRLARSIRAK